VVRKTALFFTAWLAAAASFAIPLATVAQEGAAGAPAVYHYSTAITTAYGSPYPVAGHLDIEVFPNGILRGYYHSAYQKQFIPVTGGRDGNYIWFDIGPSLVDLGIGNGPNGSVHIVATMDGGGAFKGQLFPRPASSDVSTNDTTDTTTTATATATTTAIGEPPGGVDQYLFSAKPTEKSAEDYPQPLPSP
jgi:hypothetical protein